MQRARTLVFPLLLAAAAACGGKQNPPPEPTGAGAGATGPAAEEGQGGAATEGGATVAASAGQAADLPPIPSSPAPAPESLFASVALGNPAQFVKNAGAYVDAVQPGLGQKVDTGMFSDIANQVTGARLAGVDYSKPMWGLLLDPNEVPKPFVIVAAVADGAAMQSAASKGGLLVQRHQGYAAIGTKSALEAVAAHALSTLPAGAAPKQPTATIYVAAIMKRYEAQMRQVVPLLVAQAGQGPEAETAKNLITGMVSLLSQTDVVRIGLDLASRASVLVDVVPRSGTDIQKAFSKQKPATFELMEQAFAATFSFGGRLNWSATGDFFQKMAAGTVRQVYGEGAATKLLDGFYKLLDGEIAMAGDVGAGGKISLEGRWSLSKPKKAQKLLLRTLSALSKQSKKGKGGTFDFKFRPRAFRHLRVSVSSLSSKPNESAPAAQREAYKRLWGDDAVRSFFAMVDGGNVMAAGDGAKARIKELIALAKGKKKAEVPPAAGKAIADAKSRKESLLALVDVAGLGAKIKKGAGLKAGGDPLALGVGFDGGVLSLRLTVPAAQARAFPALAGQIP